MLTHRWSKFQSTRHTGRDDLPTSGWVRGSNFNPRATRGATSVFAKVNKSIFRFQSTRHTGRDWLLSLFYACFQHFNPRATRGATGRGFIYFAVGFISIHAPHGARLFKAYCLQDVVAISIHAPHGARLTTMYNGLSTYIFQSTRHTGRDSKNLQQYPKRFVIDEYCFILNCTI